MACLTYLPNLFHRYYLLRFSIFTSVSFVTQKSPNFFWLGSHSTPFGFQFFFAIELQVIFSHNSLNLFQIFCYISFPPSQPIKMEFLKCLLLPLSTHTHTHIHMISRTLFLNPWVLLIYKRDTVCSV